MNQPESPLLLSRNPIGTLSLAGTGSTGIPSLKTALSLVGGASKLARLRSATVSLATASVPTKLQLAVHIAQRHYTLCGRADLELSIRDTLADSYEIENLAYLLNMQDAPWAIAVSKNHLTWQPVDSTDLECLKTRGDFVEMIFHHLR